MSLVRIPLKIFVLHTSQRHRKGNPQGAALGARPMREKK